MIDVMSGLRLKRGESVLVRGGGGGARFSQRRHCIRYGLPKWPAVHKLTSAYADKCLHYFTEKSNMNIHTGGLMTAPECRPTCRLVNFHKVSSAIRK